MDSNGLDKTWSPARLPLNPKSPHQWFLPPGRSNPSSHLDRWNNVKPADDLGDLCIQCPALTNAIGKYITPAVLFLNPCPCAPSHPASKPPASHLFGCDWSAGLLRQLKQVMDFPGNYLGNLWTLVPYLFPETRTAQSRMHVRAASVQSCARSAPTKPWVLDATSCGKEWLRLSKRREQAQRRHGFISKWRSCFSVWSVSKRRPFYKTEHVRHCRIKALTIPPVSHQSPTSYFCSGCAESPTCLDCHVASTGPTNRVPQSKIMLEAQGIWINMF